jgi:hypothetical protein
MKGTSLNGKFGLRHLVLALLTGALLVGLGILWSGGGNTSTVNVQKGAVQLNVSAPADAQQSVKSNDLVPPANVQPAFGTLNACHLATDVVTYDGGFVPITPEHGVGNNSTNCTYTSDDSLYSVIVDVQPYATSTDYYDSLSADQYPTDLPAGMTQGVVTYPDFGITAPNVSLAYQYSGTFDQGGYYTTVVFLATGADGTTYLVNATLEQTFNNVPQGNSLQMAADAALSLP